MGRTEGDGQAGDRAHDATIGGHLADTGEKCAQDHAGRAGGHFITIFIVSWPTVWYRDDRWVHTPDRFRFIPEYTNVGLLFSHQFGDFTHPVGATILGVMLCRPLPWQIGSLDDECLSHPGTLFAVGRSDNSITSI